MLALTRLFACGAGGAGGDRFGGGNGPGRWGTGRCERGHESFGHLAIGCQPLPDAGLVVPLRPGPAGDRAPQTGSLRSDMAASPPAMVPRRSAEVTCHRTGRSILLTAGQPVMGAGNPDRHTSPGAQA